MRLAGRSGADLVASAITVFAGFFVLREALGFSLGTARDMGPGYFPFMAGCGLVVTGLGIFLVEGRRPLQHEGQDALDLRPIVMILASILLFALLIERLGFVPAVFLSLFVGSLADRQSTPLFAAVLSGAITLVTYCIFALLLGLQLQAFWS